MKKKSAFLLSVLMLCSLWACKNPLLPHGEWKIVNLHIKGTITDINSNKPINGAKATLVWNLDNAEAKTDDKGQFSLVASVVYAYDPPLVTSRAEAEGYQKSEEKFPKLTEEWQIIDFQLYPKKSD